MVRCRLSSVSGLCVFLEARGDVPTNRVPHGLPTRRERRRPHQAVPLVRRVARESEEVGLEVRSDGGSIARERLRTIPVESLETRGTLTLSE